MKVGKAEGNKEERKYEERKVIRKEGKIFQQLLYLCLFWSWISITGSNCQLYSFLNSILCL